MQSETFVETVSKFVHQQVFSLSGGIQDSYRRTAGVCETRYLKRRNFLQGRATWVQVLDVTSLSAHDAV